MSKLDYISTPEYSAWWNANRTKLANLSIYSKGAAIWNAALSAPSVASGAQELPPLPRPVASKPPVEDMPGKLLFDSAQMHNYARSAIAAQAKTVGNLEVVKVGFGWEVRRDGKPIAYGDSQLNMQLIAHAWNHVASAHILANSAPNALLVAALTQTQLSKAARHLSDEAAIECGVDKDDAWKVYGKEEIEGLRAALAAAGVEVNHG